ncbi:unnamed protein product [Clonostachys rhizophaga]|uniref:Glutathione S-transferase UstS-like C-terminal domain-containing protein n=1 Tax=Clonostachys rhizophaga TaxID=160324 RepID=A0A9N9VNP9_9HYPO|nr:unnamed protein product [Clonostachys rhizophaga]
MSTDNTITFFDIPTKEPKTCWSFNTWRDYKTEWVSSLRETLRRLTADTVQIEYPDLKPTFEPHLPPNEMAGGIYTAPTIRLPDGTYIMDSKHISALLEEKYPEPSIHLDPKLYARLIEQLKGGMGSLTTVYVTQVPARLLSQRSVEFFKKTREEMLGMALEEYAKSIPRDEAFAKAVPYLRKITEMLQEKEGPFFKGEQVSYTDFVWAGVLLFFKVQGDETFEDFMESTGDRTVHEKFLEALSPWTKRHD